MKVTIIGGGNIGTLLAAEFAYKGYSVTVYTSNPTAWSNELFVYSQDNKLMFSTGSFFVTSSLESAVRMADQIWITVPAFMFQTLAKQLTPLLSKSQTIICVPGSGGTEFAFYDAIKKGCTLCGLQRVHSIARLKEYGRSVFMLGRKESIQIASIPSKRKKQIAYTLSDMLDMPCTILDNYLAVTLAPSNSILHTTRLYSMFKDYYRGIVYDRNILFYEEWTEEASEIMINCDAELQMLCMSLIPLDMNGVKSLKDHYESYTIKSMTKKIQSIVAFKGLLSPMKQIDKGWIPDFNSRYFTADFSYGLKVILDIANLMKIKVPEIERVWNWYIALPDVQNRKFFTLPLLDKKQLIELYI